MENSADKELKDLGYPQHILDAFSQGVALDFRVRFAMQLLTHSPIFTEPGMSLNPSLYATHALDISVALFDQAKERGMLSSLDHETPLPEDLAKQAQRIGAFEAHKQIGAARAMQSAQGAVVPVAPGSRMRPGH